MTHIRISLQLKMRRRKNNGLTIKIQEFTST